MDFNVEYTVTDGDDVVVLVISGPMDVETVPGLRDLIARLIEDGHRRLVLDVSQVDFIDSIGLGVIVGVVHRLRPHDGSLALVDPSAQVRRVLEITQLVRVVAVHESADAAVSAVRAGDAVVSAPRRLGDQPPVGRPEL